MKKNMKKKLKMKILKTKKFSEETIKETDLEESSKMNWKK
jgi:hypothetical protein